MGIARYGDVWLKVVSCAKHAIGDANTWLPIMNLGFFYTYYWFLCGPYERTPWDEDEMNSTYAKALSHTDCAAEFGHDRETAGVEKTVWRSVDELDMGYPGAYQRIVFFAIRSVHSWEKEYGQEVGCKGHFYKERFKRQS